MNLDRSYSLSENAEPFDLKAECPRCKAVHRDGIEYDGEYFRPCECGARAVGSSNEKGEKV
jgi:hypothetical protein